MKKLILALVIGIGIAFPATAGAATFSGIVVAKQARRHALIVASQAGVVRAVHTHHLATRIGARVAVHARKLADGTFSATSFNVRGRAQRAKIHGIVVKAMRGRLLISAGHSVLSVRTRQARQFSLNDHGAGGPKPGDVVNVVVSTNAQQLDEEDMQDVGHSQSLQLEGTIVSVTPATSSTDGEIVLQVGKSSIDIAVPAGTTLPALKAGDSVQLEVTLSGSTFTLANAQGENDDQGEDDQGDDGGSGSGDGGGDD